MFEKICFHKEFIEYSIIGFRFLCTLLYPSSRDELGSVFCLPYATLHLVTMELAVPHLSAGLPMPPRGWKATHPPHARAADAVAVAVAVAIIVAVAVAVALAIAVADAVHQSQIGKPQFGSSAVTVAVAAAIAVAVAVDVTVVFAVAVTVAVADAVAVAIAVADAVQQWQIGKRSSQLQAPSDFVRPLTLWSCRILFPLHLSADVRCKARRIRA